MNFTKEEYEMVFNDLMEASKDYLVDKIICNMSDEEKKHYLHCLLINESEENINA